MKSEEMMHIHKLSERIWEEIEKTEPSSATIKNLGEAVDILKDLSEIKKNCATIEAMDEYFEDEEDSGYGRVPNYPHWGSRTYGAMRRGRNANGTYRSPYYGQNDEEHERLSRYLERKMADASTDEERDIIRGCMERLG